MIPTLVLHDVLQTTLFSRSQLEVLKEKSMSAWFADTVQRLQGQRLKLVVVAEGILADPFWTTLICNSDWEVQCHGWEHKVMHLMSEEDAYQELSKAKDLMETTFNQKVTQFYPPKHKISDNLIKASHRAGMNIMLDRWRPVHALEGVMFIPEVYIHYWHKGNVDEALKLLNHL